MPDNFKSGIESLSGFSMDDVRVHYNSDKPASVQALAYTQGTDIHVAPGQEHALPHEAWHVAQQMAGRVSPTTNINGMPVNDNAGLEHEADVMGEKAVTLQRKRKKFTAVCSNHNVAQRLVLRCGNDKNIQDDAMKIAKEHDELRGKEIAVQNLEDIQESCYDLMMSEEPIYIVSHGVSALGNEPAHLEGDDDKCIDGSYLACIISNIINKLRERNKKIGNIKIEACLSSDKSLGRNSLVEDVDNCLKQIYNESETFYVMGNLGLAMGTDYDDQGVTITNPVATKMCLLLNILGKIRDKKILVEHASALQKDADVLIQDILDHFKEESELRQRIKHMLGEFFPEKSLDDFFDIIKKIVGNWEVDGNINNIETVILLSKDVDRIKVESLEEYAKAEKMRQEKKYVN